jgi:hypothetical protein
MDCLNTALKLGGHYRDMHVPFRAWAEQAAGWEVLDLGSGGGGPADTLLDGARRAGKTIPKLILSDLHPSLSHFRALQEKYGDGAVGYLAEPVDAANVNCRHVGLRSMCTAFHHLPPAEAEAVVRDAALHAEGLFVLESFRRDIRHLLMVVLSGPFVYMLAPFQKGCFSWKKLALCTLFPVVPLMVLFDGCVSVLRTYSPDEIRDFFPEDLRDRYRFEAGDRRYMGFFRATYFCATRMR